MLSIDEPAVCAAHSLRRQFGRRALAECCLRIDRAVAAQNYDGMCLWTDALRRLRSGQDLRH
jgi:hypothetical protein